MEVRKPVSAEEERRQKLLEYLAAKGKLKPQNNKPYLKDSTNLQKKPLTHRSKAPQINKQKEDVVPKKTKHIPKASSNLPLQRQTKMVHSKMSARDNVSATSKPRSRTMPSAAVPSKNVIPCKSLKQKKGETQVTADTASCAILCNSGKEAEAGEESGERILLIEPKGKQCSLNIDGENFINENRTAELVVSCRAKQIVQQVQKPVTIKSLDNHGKPQAQKSSCMVASTSRNPSRDFSLKKKASWHNEISKSLHPVTSKLESHPVHRAESTKTCTASMQNRAAGKTIHVNSARTTSLHAKVSHSIQTAAASCPVTKTCSHLHKPVGRPQNSSALTKPATIQHGTGNTAKTSLNNHTTRTINKQSAKEQVAKSSHGTVPPRLQNTTNLWHKQKADAVSSSMKTPSGKRTNSLHKASVMNAAGSSTSVHLSNMQGSDEMSNRYTTPKTAAEDRKRRLEEWLLTKGKTYKRPPMTMPPKKPDKSKTPGIQSSFLWAEIEEEEELLLLSQRINATLSECLELINKGAPSQDIHSALGKIPHAKKFAKFWVCKARLNEREGIFDVIDLYEQGVKSGAQPMNELRDAIFDIMKSTSKKSKAVTFGPLPSKERVPVNEALEHSRCPISTSVKKRRDEGTPCGRLTTSEQGSAIKFQVSRVSSIKKETGCQEWKRLTPVRRSVRISEAMPRYPEVLKEHDTVVASLGELLDMADTDAVLYTRNEALPDEADEDLLDMINQDRSELKEEPV